MIKSQLPLKWLAEGMQDAFLDKAIDVPYLNIKQ